uniref:Anaphase-promoting complex subunit 4 WD40 domain-containing protein n=1 Tax=Ditylum brightwellii TaxID=49249 RepID=A0A7S4RXE7_9STRA
MAGVAVDPITCSDQPLCISFHPTRDIVAAGLVDGTLEVHDFSSIANKPKPPKPSKKMQLDSDSDDDSDTDELPKAKITSNAVEANSDSDSEEEDTIQSTLEIHTAEKPSSSSTSAHGSASLGKATQNPSCRAVLFDSVDATQIYTCGNGGGLCALDTELACSMSYTHGDAKTPILWRMENSHKTGINKVFQLPPSASSLLVTGDDEGVVKLWDTRMCGNAPKKSGFDNCMTKQKGCVTTFSSNNDYISGFECDADGTTLLASSADCTLSIFDIRKISNAYKKGRDLTSTTTTVTESAKRSDDQEDELLSICTMKRGKKVVCGTQDGVLAIWSWGTWGDISDRFPGHPHSIDALLKVDEDTMLTGCSDGLVRVVQIQPDKLLGVLGDHDGFPVESLSYSAEKRFIGSVSHDCLVRLWDAKIFFGDSDDEDDEEEEDGKESAMDTGATTTTAAAAAKKSRNDAESDDEWEDMDEDENMKDSGDSDDDSDDSDDDSDDSGGGTNRMGRKFKTDSEKFFEDL